MSNFIPFLQEHRIESTDRILIKLADLGATEVSDLLDLTAEDLSSFKPPVMKKLEFTRFRRAIELLQTTKNNDVQSPPNVANQNSMNNDSTGKTNEDTMSSTYESPPIPPSCPNDGCSGTLSSTLGKRLNKMLVKLNGPDFRWLVSCSNCDAKWHSCHFLCGYMSKIASNGSSDISRHEIGRYNRWQKKIIRPCVNNPDFENLKTSYYEEDRIARSSDHGVVKIPKDITYTVENNVAPSDLRGQKQKNDGKTTKFESNGETLTTQSISFDIDDNLLSEGGGDILDLCNGTTCLPVEKKSTSKRVKLADGSFSQGETKPDSEIDDMCDEVRMLLLLGDG